MKLFTRAVTICLAGLMFCTLDAAALDGGGARSGGSKGEGRGGDNSLLGSKRPPEMEYIAEHSRELGITPEQRKKLEYLQDKIDQSREKVLRSAAMRDTYRELLALKKDGEEEKFREVREKAREAVAKLGAGDELKEDYAKILTPEQIAKIKEGREAKAPEKKVAEKAPEKEKGGDRDREVGETKKADPNKPPSLFNDK